jgi:hypothetical protein
LPAIEGYLPIEMMHTIRAFLEFCYIAWREVVDTESLNVLEEALSRFHHYRVIFEECGVRTEGFNLPRQHFLEHYPALIRTFGAPNGLCSSITESKHIKAVKQPWRRSNRYNALGQMLLTNERIDKIAACRVDFVRRGMLADTLSRGRLSYIYHSEQMANLGLHLMVQILKKMMTEGIPLDRLFLLR